MGFGKRDEVTDAAPTHPRVLDELVPAAWHHIARYVNNRIEADHGRLKTPAAAGIDTHPPLRVTAAFTELAQAI